MSTTAASIDSAPTPESSISKNSIAKLGMIIFLFSEAMLFAGLIASYFVLASGLDAWPPEGAPEYMIGWSAVGPISLPVPHAFMHWLVLINTVILVSSSFTWHFGEVAARKGKSATLWYVVTCLLGFVFLCIQGYEWWHLAHYGLWFGSEEWVNNPGWALYGGNFYVLTGFHGLHVAIGLIACIYATIKTAKGELRKAVSPESAPAHEDHTVAELSGLYWHFVDVVWIIVFASLYLIDIEWLFNLGG